MLQIITGKFFTTDELNITRQRGVLYTNYNLNIFQKIETISGTLLPVDIWSDVSSLIYEVDQRLEAIDKDGKRSFMVATHFDPLIQDFAAIASFVLDITCTPDLELTRRLTQSKRPQLGVSQIPSEFITRVFDSKIQHAEGDEEKFQEFMKELVGLERRNYEAAIRAIRRYVTGLHRISDDLDLAYTLLVASIESLAQEFDDFKPTWEDYDQNKRETIDKALKDASDETIQKVHNAILAQEYISLSRRFKEFTLAHLNPSFFREEVIKTKIPVSRADLVAVLNEAYRFRSKYVHTLRELPKVLTTISHHNDTFDVFGKPMLTLQGLARVAKHVIKEFVYRGAKVDWEDYDYRSNLPNIVYGLRLAERYWIWQREGYNHKSAYRYLNGFLSELTAVLMKETGAQITNITQILEEIEKQVKGLANYKQRLPMLTLYLLFHVYLPKECHRPNCDDLIDKYVDDFTHSTVEALLVSVLVKNFLTMSVDEFEETRNMYFSQRHKKNAIEFGHVFEAAITLALAEMYRQNGNETRSRELVSETVEIYPGHVGLLEFENKIKDELPEINWWEILLPKNNPSNENSNLKTSDEN